MTTGIEDIEDVVEDEFPFPVGAKVTRVNPHPSQAGATGTVVRVYREASRVSVLWESGFQSSIAVRHLSEVA